MKRRTVVIGLDGATFTVLDPLIQAGEMPFLNKFLSEGVRAELRSTVPALTPPAWTTLMTGTSPGQHGIFDFFRKESAESQHIRFLTSKDVTAETIWSHVNTHGMRATVLNFPMTFPAPTIDGNVVPGGWMPWRQLRLGCHPSDLFDRLKALSGFSPKELAMDMTHEERALEGCQKEEYEDWVDLHIRREQQWFEVYRYLMAEDPSELTGVLFDGPDKIQHLCWRFVDPAYADSLSEDWEFRVRDRCLDYFREIDRMMSHIVSQAGPEATVFVASDHGFGAQVRTLFANAWLEQEGHLAWMTGQEPQTSETQLVGMRQIARHVYLMDWDKTRAYAPLPSGNGIHIVKKDSEHPNGVSDKEYEALRDGIIQRLGELTDPETGEQVVARVWKREDIFAGPNLDLAPDLTLEMADGGLISILSSKEVVVRKESPSGTHAPLGIFAARGPGIRRDIRGQELSILDVAPMILYSLDLPIPENMEGIVSPEVFEPTLLQERPVRHGERTSPRPGGETGQEQVYTEEDEKELAKRLRALGYIE